MGEHTPGERGVAETRLYRHPGGIVRLEQDEHGKAFLRRLDESYLRAEAVRAATWLTKETEPATPSDHQIRDMLTVVAPLPVLPLTADAGLRGRWNAHHHAGFQERHPLRAGRRAGWSGADSIGEADMRRSHDGAQPDLRDDLLYDFPFEDGSDMAHAIALLVVTACAG